MAFLTKEQIAKLAEVIRQHATWLTWRILGSSFITEADLQQLKQAGLLPMDVQIESIRYSFVLGELESLLKEGQWKNLEFDALVAAVEAKQTPVQELQIKASELSAYSQFRGLENDLQEGLYESLASASQSAIDDVSIKEKIKDVIKVGVEARKNYREVARDLIKQLQENKRNWHRVASTEMHSARQRGIVSAILSGTDVYRFADGANSNVAVRPNADACSDCKRLYLDPKTGNPKIFKLSELLANEGSNYIRPWRKNAKPVIPPLHSHCFCMIRYIPDGWGWNKEGKYTLVDPEESLVSMKKEKEGSAVKKAHELLNQASYIPADEQIAALTEDEIPIALGKIDSLKEMHSDNYELWHQLDALENKVHVQAIKLSEMQRKGSSNVG